MSLESALLGYLWGQPMTGYDLKKAFDLGIANFWPAPQSQIYNVLHRLEDQGCLTVETIPQDAKPNRKLYRITKKGEARLREWLEQPHPPLQAREPFLLHLWLCGFVDDDVVLRFLDATVERLRTHLSYLEKIPGGSPDVVKAQPRVRYFWYLTLNYGIRHTRFLLEWVEEIVERVKQKEYQEGKRGAVRGLFDEEP